MTKSRKLTLISLNLWRFYDWEKRFPFIIELLKKIDPDVILTQETQLDQRFYSRNQVEILNEHLQYPYVFFAKAEVKTKQKGQPVPFPIDHGLGVFSKFSCESEIIFLKQASDDKEKRIIVKNNIDIDGVKISVVNVHFSNSDRWAEDHFKETLAILNSDPKNIIAGDFNIFNLKKYKELYDEKYRASSDEYEYISYPDDKASLDYILIPKDYKFENFECREEYVSDHRMIIATIILPDNI